MNLISEFFFEGIRRIIPGLILIILYWHKEAENVFHNHADFFSPYLFSVAVIVIAWLIGFTVEMLTYWTVAPPLKMLSRYNKRICKILDHLMNWGQNSDLQETDPILKLELRRQRYLYETEKIMSRCLFIIFLVAWIWPPIQPPKFIAECFSSKYHSLYFLILSIVFLIAWISRLSAVRGKIAASKNIIS
jgi:uncharacterized membrane protein